MDLNVRAFRVVRAAIDGPSATPPSAKQEAARKGGLRGGPARAQSISSERRKEIAKKASRARWSRKPTNLPMA
jgi:hypothetical protein